MIGRWGDDTALLRTDDGQTLEVPVPEPLREAIDVGAEATVHGEGNERVEWHVEAPSPDTPSPQRPPDGG